MKISCEAPLSWMPRVSKHIDFEYALAHRLNENEYFDFFAQKAREGKTIYLDNSAFELGEAFSADDLLELYEDLITFATYPHEVFVIAPDVLGHREKNHEKIMEFFKIANATAGPDIIPQIFATIQGSTLKDRIHSYKKLSDEGISNFTIPGGWVKGKDGKMHREPEDARLKLVSMIPWKPYDRAHLLGCMDVTKLPFYQEYTNVISVDSSFPIAMALEGNELTPMGADKPATKIDDNFFREEPTGVERKLIARNIKTLKGLAGK